jgi:hypothetical protein
VPEIASGLASSQQGRPSPQPEVISGIASPGDQVLASSVAQPSQRGFDWGDASIGAGVALAAAALASGCALALRKRSQRKRLSVATVALTVGVLALAGTAGATRPYMERVVQGPDTLSDTCSFPVLIQPTAPDVSNFFVFSDGEIFGAGPFVGTATNLDTGKTVMINLSGHFTFVQHSDGSITVTSDGSVLSTLFGTIFSGHGVIELDANGNVTSRTFNGTEQDLCAELAGP